MQELSPDMYQEIELRWVDRDVNMSFASKQRWSRMRIFSSSEYTRKIFLASSITSAMEKVAASGTLFIGVPLLGEIQLIAWKIVSAWKSPISRLPITQICPRSSPLDVFGKAKNDSE